jgi:hypothetical protein
MSLPFTFAAPPVFGRVFGAAVLLLALSAPGLCFAAEKTFSDTYSVELPAGWTGDLQKDKSLMGAGPGGVSFGFKAYPSDVSPAEYVEKALANTEKRPGYKLIEKTAVKTSPDRKALRIRYQTDGPKGTESLVKFYFQLVDKEVVILLFQLPNFSSASAKNDIEAIFNSVKVATAAGQEDSWATPSPDKSKESSKTTGADYSEIAGKYVSSQRSSDYILLKADGTFSFQISGESGSSTYTRNGGTITLKFGDDPDDAKLEKDALVDSSGKRWVKKP